MSEHFLLDRILQPGGLSVCFQPVLELHGARVKPHYYEALTRGPRGTSVEAPTILFEYARKKSRESAVDRACVAVILDATLGLPAGSVVGINVHASTLAMDEGFVDFLAIALESRGLSASRLVVEIVEHAPPWDVAGLHTALDGLRRLGVRIALDDVGLGHSNFLMILECRPDYLKIDRHFVDGCHHDFHRRAVLDAVTQLARSFGARVVGEGVEHPGDLATLRRLGISLIQGFLLGRPTPASEIPGLLVPPPPKTSRGHGSSPRAAARR